MLTSSRRKLALDFMDTPFSDNAVKHERELQTLHAIWLFVTKAWEEGRLTVGNIRYDVFAKLSGYQRVYAQEKGKSAANLKRKSFIYPAVHEPSGNQAQLIELRSVPELRKYIKTELSTLEARLANRIPTKSLPAVQTDPERKSLDVRLPGERAQQ